MAETESKELYLPPSHLIISIHLPGKSCIVNNFAELYTKNELSVVASHCVRGLHQKRSVLPYILNSSCKNEEDGRLRLTSKGLTLPCPRILFYSCSYLSLVISSVY